MDQNTEYPGVNINNLMPGNPPEPTSTSDNNTPKVDTVDKSDAKEDKNQNKEAIQDKEGFEIQVNSLFPEKNAYGRRPEDTDYAHASNQALSIDAQAIITQTSWSTSSHS